MRQFFAPPLPDPHVGWVNNTATNENGAELNMDEGPNDDVSIGSDEEIVDGIQHQLEAHIAGLKSVEVNEDGEVDNSTKSDTVNDGSNNSADEEQFDENIPSSDTFEQFKSMIQETSTLREVLIESGKLMSMLTLGCDKGSIDIGGKFKSRSERWFGTRKTSEEGLNVGQRGPDQSLVQLRRDSVIVLHVKKGGREMLLEYRALAFFIKYYGKWFVSMPDEFYWKLGNGGAVPKGRVLARLLEKHGDSYEDAKLVAGGEWAPNHVFISVTFDEIVSVGDELVDM
jgi:hypothetical protein